MPEFDKFGADDLVILLNAHITIKCSGRIIPHKYQEQILAG